MDTDNEHHEIDKKLNAQRDIIRQSLDAIANDIGMAMRDVGLSFPALHHRPELWRCARDYCNSVSIHQIPIGSRHRQSSVGPLKKGLAAVGWEGENSPALSRTPGR